MKKQTAKKGGGGLWSIVASFRADKRAKDAGDINNNHQRPKKNQQQAAPNVAVLSTRALLKEHGYLDDHFEEALQKCGPDLVRCIDYCLRKEETSATDDGELAMIPVGE